MQLVKSDTFGLQHAEAALYLVVTITAVVGAPEILFCALVMLGPIIALPMTVYRGSVVMPLP